MADTASSSYPFLNSFEPIDRHRHHLPHWQQNEVWQFVTWRLDDSLPTAKLLEWKAEQNAWMRRHPKPWDAATECEYHETFSARLDEWLDAGHGSCVLRDSACSRIVAEAFHYFANVRYELNACVVMPNHVHVIFRPLDGFAVDEIVHSWKSFTAKAINKVIGKNGTLWQEDYWDRMIRGEAHLAACRRYIESNPVKVALQTDEYRLYVNSPSS